jgi:hypothetical protein
MLPLRGACMLYTGHNTRWRAGIIIAVIDGVKDE